MANYLNDKTAKYYYSIFEDGKQIIICNPLSFETQDSIKRFKGAKETIRIKSINYARPDLIVDETNSKIVLPHLHTSNIHCIKHILGHIYEHGSVSKKTPIVFNKITVGRSYANTLLDIFENTDIQFVYDADEQTTIKMCNFLKDCEYRFNSVIAIISNIEEFALTNSCRSLTSDNLHSFIFYRILYDNNLLKDVQITKLNLNNVYDIEMKPLNNIHSITIQEIQMQHNSDLITPYAQYIHKILSSHRQSLKSISMNCLFSVLTWNNICSENMTWPRLSNVSVCTNREAPKFLTPQKMSYFPLLVNFNIKSEIMIRQPSMKYICIKHSEVNDSYYEPLAILLAKNRKYIRATMTWLIVCKFHLNIYKDIALKIAHMVIEDDISYSDESMNLTRSDFATRNLWCRHTSPECDMLIFVTPSQVEEWLELNGLKSWFASTGLHNHMLSSDIKKFNQEIKQKNEEISGIKSKLNNRRAQLKRAKNRESEYKDDLDEMIKRLKK